MTIEADIVTALGAIGTPVYPEAAPQDATLPLVIYRRTSYEPVNVLGGYAGIAKSIFLFECWAKKKADTLTIASTVIGAIESSTIQTKTLEPSTGEDYEPGTDAFVEPVTFSFWHP